MADRVHRRYENHAPAWPIAVGSTDSMLPVELPEITGFAPRTSDDPDALPGWLVNFVAR